MIFVYLYISLLEIEVRTSMLTRCKRKLISFQVSSHIIKNKTSRDGMLIQRISTVLYKNTTLTFMWEKKHTGEHKGKHHILIIAC